MKTRTLAIALVLLTVGTNLSAQGYGSYSDRYGHTLNIGLGIGAFIDFSTGVSTIMFYLSLQSSLFY